MLSVAAKKKSENRFRFRKKILQNIKWGGDGSVVRTSVFGRQTFPDLCPIYGWYVNKLSRYGSAKSAFHQSRGGKWVEIYVIITRNTGVETTKQKTRAIRMVVWLKAKVRVCGLGCGLGSTPAVCDAQQRCSCSMWCYMKVPLRSGIFYGCNGTCCPKLKATKNYTSELRRTGARYKYCCVG